jgi:hypothetical protein
MPAAQADREHWPSSAEPLGERSSDGRSRNAGRAVGLNQVTFTPGGGVADRLFEGEEAVPHVMGKEIEAPERPHP